MEASSMGRGREAVQCKSPDTWQLCDVAMIGQNKANPNHTVALRHGRGKFEMFSQQSRLTGQQPAIYHSSVGLSRQLPSGLVLATQKTNFGDVFGVFLLHSKITFGGLLAIDLVAIVINLSLLHNQKPPSRVHTKSN
ncbi:hypothetical protein MRB53_010134 [Persea americana]|uniref:Uncharacterized protein n=1 Tax=Persea americana TaxID=3435 RepID=A0ACC2LRZ3_PERAE|nr:hypothetical protein MRB53_010134 [Persea americana]